MPDSVAERWRCVDITQLSKNFGGVVALDRVSMTISPREIVAVIGPNGSGKTTLIDVISGFITPDSGAISWEGKQIQGLKADKVVKLGVARTFQLIRVLPQMTVKENLFLALERPQNEGVIRSFNPFFRYRTNELEEKAMELLRWSHLSDKCAALAGSLSHGQRRLLELTRAVALDARVYLLDEPSAGVFPELRTRMSAMLKDLRDRGKAILFVEHNMEMVRSTADRVIVLDSGSIVAEGPTQQTLANAAVLSAYFGGTCAS